MDWGLVFALLGHYFGFDPKTIGGLTMPQVSMYLRTMPEVQKRIEAGNATLAWLTAAVHSNKSKYDQWFSPYAKTGKESMYTGDLAIDIRTALRLTLMTQNILDMLDNDEVRRAMEQIKDR